MPVPDYYEVLGLRRDARPAEITPAFNRWVGQFKKDTTPPDPRRESLLREAHEVLSDAKRRAEYDRELSESRDTAVPRRKPAARWAIGACVAVALAAGAAWLAFRPGSPAPKARSAEQLVSAASSSVSTLVAYDTSGKATPAGVAFVIEDKVMLSSCQGVSPGAQLMVDNGARKVAARVLLADDALGLCKLATDSYVGEPLRISTTAPAAGDKVYAASVGLKGEVTLREGQVARVLEQGGVKAIEAPFAAGADMHGAPLLDGQGRVVAIATRGADGQLRHRVVPAGWLAEGRPRAAEPRPYQEAPVAATPAAPAAADPATKALAEEGQRKIDSMPPGPAREAARRLAEEREKAVRAQTKIIEEATK